MFRQNKHKQVRQDYGVNGKAIQPTLLSFDELLITDGVRHSDISLYLHQQTLSDVDAFNIKEYIDTQVNKASPVNPFDGWSDDKLLSICKSRRCNSLTDMKQYIDWLSDTSQEATNYRENLSREYDEEQELKNALKEYKRRKAEDK